MIHAQVWHQIIPLAFFLMERRTVHDYQIALVILRTDMYHLPAPNAPVAVATRCRPITVLSFNYPVV